MSRKRRGKRRRRGGGVAPLIAKNPTPDCQNGTKTNGKCRSTPKQSKNTKRGHDAVEGTPRVYSLNLSDPAVSKGVDVEWYNEQPVPPAHPDRLTPDQCAEFRGRLSEWLTIGLSNAQNRSDAASEPGTHAACWNGKVINVDISSVIIADNAVAVAGEVSQKHGYAVIRPCRGHVGLDEDSDRRVLQWVCEHDACQPDEKRHTLEMMWPVGNAVLESWDPNTGFVTPRTAMNYEKFQRGIETTASEEDRIDEWVTLSLSTRLRIDPGTRRQKPIDTRRIVRDRHGDLLTVRPEILPRAKVNFRDVEDYLRNRREGAAYKEMTTRFGVSQSTIKRNLDNLNPEFVARGVADRLVCQKRDGVLMWLITDTANVIDTYVAEFGKEGREFDTVYTVANTNTLTKVPSFKAPEGKGAIQPNPDAAFSSLTRALVFNITQKHAEDPRIIVKTETVRRW